MSSLEQLSIGDFRSDLTRSDWSIGRYAQKASLTLHYNGPAVADRTHGGEVAQLKHDASFHVNKVWGSLSNGKPLYGDGIMYHFAVLSDGTLLQLRDLDAILWHCANEDGNRRSIAVHMPLGGNQDATDEQWQAFGQLADALIADYNMGSRQQVRGHREWPRLDGQPQSFCPGERLMQRLLSWRATRTEFEVLGDANVREGPGTTFPVALGGTALLSAGDVFAADTIVFGAPVGNEYRWAHHAAGIGFVHLSLLQPVGA